MQQTPNLGLNKPEGTDVVNVEDLNVNADILDAKLGASGHSHNGTAGNGPKLTAAGLADGAATDTVIGTRTITDTVAAASGAGTLTNLLSKIGYMIKSITGKSNWYTFPAINLQTIYNLFGISGHSHNGTAGQGPKIAYSNITDTPSSLPANGGNATTATKLAIARTISLTGAVTGSVNTDLSGNVNIATQANTTDHVIAATTPPTGWYRKWASGWTEQGGTLSFTPATIGGNRSISKIITLPTPMTSTTYTGLACSNGHTAAKIVSRTATSITVEIHNLQDDNGTTTSALDWVIKGK
jgi:hypothetical protein